MYNEVVVPDVFGPGSIMLFETDMEVSASVITWGRAEDQNISPDLDEICTSDADAAFGELDLVDLNVVLHRADGEEKDATGELYCPCFTRRAQLTGQGAEMACTASPTMVVLSTAVWRAGCTHSARSCGPMTSATPFALTSVKVHGHLTMFWNGFKSKLLPPCAAIWV
jgi:hypothetical protein